MENPFEVLGIEDITKEQQIRELEDRLRELKDLKKHMLGKHIKGTFGIQYRLSNINGKIEEYLNEQYNLGLNPNKKFFSKEDLDKLYGTIFEEQDERFKIFQAMNPEEQAVMRRGIRVMHNAFAEQAGKVNRDISEYTTILSEYRKNPNNSKAGAALNDLYLKKKYEDKVVQVAGRIAETLPKPERIEASTIFYDALTTDSEYQQLTSAYNMIATVEARQDLIPEKYVKRRMVDTSGLLVMDEEYIEKLLERDEQYYSEFIKTRKFGKESRYRMGYAENQQHDYGWGIVLTDPRFLIENEPVDTPDFKGKLTVENIGYFTEESLFTKRQHTKERRVEIKIDDAKRQEMLSRYRIDPTKAPFATLREYEWKYEATKNLFDRIYKVTKTDTEGRITSSIVFSPIVKRDIEKKEGLDFIRDVYFSEYMLGLARQNGGYAGQLLKSPRGYSVSNKYSYEEIASAVLFDRGTEGYISDRRDDRNITYPRATKEDFVRLMNQSERTREEYE